MKLDALLTTLRHDPVKTLLFQLGEDTTVPSAYHVTEVKRMQSQSIDCGGNIHEAHEVVFQLWLPPGHTANQQTMSAEKFLSIFHKVDDMLPLDRDATVRFEYQHQSAATLYGVLQTQRTDSDVYIVLDAPHTTCKALDVSAACCDNTAETTCC